MRTLFALVVCLVTACASGEVEEPGLDLADARIDDQGGRPDAGPPAGDTGETDCADELDDDFDGTVDCQDQDCDGVDGCEFRTELTCDDGVDNDADLQIDCNDGDCSASAACAPESICDDGIDNDNDSRIDCLDDSCDGIGPCEFQTERSCDDGVDNDGDGDADCDDADCGGALGCAATCPANSTALILDPAGLPIAITDNATQSSAVTGTGGGVVTRVAVTVDIAHTFTGDLLLELASPVGTRIRLADRHGAAGDNYSGTLFVDSAPTAIAAGTPPFTGGFMPDDLLEAFIGENPDGDWIFHVTDNAGGDTGTLDAWQLLLCVCQSCEVGAACTDGADNDGDGDVDCADSDCGAVPQCIPEAACDDALDNDLDGLVDCLDGDCDGAGICEFGAEATCDDGADNDGDVLVDCYDPDCTGQPACVPESDCFDGVDNDGDGAVDCQDPGCFGVAGCEPDGEVSCTDGIDNDSDGDADCADSECAGGIQCATSCPPATTSVALTATGLPLSILDSATVQSTLAATGAGVIQQAAVAVDIAHTYTGDLALSLTSPAGTSVTLSNRHGGAGDDYAGTIFSDAATIAIGAGAPPFAGAFRPDEPLGGFQGESFAGTWTMVVTDNAGGDTGTLDAWEVLLCVCVACEVGPACADGIDNDGDGDTDCADADCAAEPACQEVCADGVDNDLDGLTDCADPDCDADPLCAEVICNDGVDNDGDGVTDCAEANCALSCALPACAAGELAYGYGETLSVPIVDNDTVGTSTAFAGPGAVTRTVVSFSANHTYAGDLDVTLVSPAGTTVDLTSDNGSSGDNYIDTVFDDRAATAITAGTAPFTGSYTPETPLSAVDGEAFAGTWTFNIADDAGGDTGTFTAFDLALCVAP